MKKRRREMKMNKVTICFLLFTYTLLCLLFIPGIVKGQPIKTTPTEILQNPANYDGKMVQFEGVVTTNSNFTANEQGFGYTHFKVTDLQNSTLPVSIYGTLSVKPGDSVKICGTFHKGKHEIEASGVETRPNKTKPLSKSTQKQNLPQIPNLPHF
jgi:cytochrome c-type biogenesis protein CcmE